jgi:hypothetical protein
MKVREIIRVRRLLARSFKLRAKAWPTGWGTKLSSGAQDSPKGLSLLSPEIHLWAGWQE